MMPSTDGFDEASVRDLGFVVIGRNEGERLGVCLGSIGCNPSRLVYVDSGSTDRSVHHARQFGATVVELDSSVPFTAARARNAGVERLLDGRPPPTFVQFLDGDTEVEPGWIGTALSRLCSDQTVVAVCGRIRERYPERSIFNASCDIDWDSPAAGVVKACAGNVMMRIGAFRAVGGFDAALIAGEEPELCKRLRAAGGTILTLDHDMVVHDVDLMTYAQWWKRCMRSGYAMTLLAHRQALETGWRAWRTPVKSATWAVGLPLVTAVGMTLHPIAGMALVLYPVRVARLYVQQRRRRRSRRTALAYALLNTASKVAELVGSIRYGWDTLTGSPARIIEHKRRAPTACS